MTQLMPLRPNSRRMPVGLEIEPSAIHAAAVEVNGKISIQHAATAQLEAGIVRDGEVTDVDGLAEALRKLFDEHRDLDKRVRIGLANQKIVVRVMELPPIADRKELDAAVRFRAQDEVAMPLDSAVMDYQPLDIIDTPDGPRQRILIVAARRDMVERVLTAARAAGLRPEGIDLAAFAMVRALHRPGPASEHVLYLSIGGLTNLAVAQGPLCLFTRVVGGGLESIAIELAERRALTLEHARGWLAHVGIERDMTEIDGDEAIVADARLVLTEGIRRLASDVRSSLDFLQTHGEETGVARAVLTGPAAAIAGFSAALSTELGMPVETGAVTGAPAGLDAELITVAAGLALEEAVA